jgi:hypothetical protein
VTKTLSTKMQVTASTATLALGSAAIAHEGRHIQYSNGPGPGPHGDGPGWRTP